MIETGQSPQVIRRFGLWRRPRLWTLAGLLLFSEAVYVAMLRFDAVSSAKSVFTFLALLAFLFLCYGAGYRVLRDLQERRGAMVLIVSGALLFRLTMLFAGLPHDSDWKEMLSAARADVRGRAVSYDRFLLFDNDIWRYLWDGHVWANRANPYLYEPSNPRLDTLASSSDSENTVWSDVRDNVNHPQVPTIYPPLAESMFYAAHALAPGSVFVMKSFFVAFDLLALLFVALTLRALDRPATDMVLYAWNPLIIKAIAGSGHMDAMVAAALAATAYFMVRGSHASAAIAWGLSVLMKLSPLVLLPFLLRRLGWRKTGLGIAVIALGYLPFLNSGEAAFAGLRTFAHRWQFNAGIFDLVQWLVGHLSADPSRLAKMICAIIFLFLLGYLSWKDDGANRSFAFYSATALGGLLVLGPTVMPWYVVWLLPLAVIARTRIWIYFSALVCLAFLVMIDGMERGGVLLLEYGIFAVFLHRNCLPFKRGAEASKCDQVLITEEQMLEMNPKTVIGEKP